MSHYNSLLGFAVLVRTAGFSCSDLACASQLDLSDAGFTVLQLRKAGDGKCTICFSFRLLFSGVSGRQHLEFETSWLARPNQRMQWKGRLKANMKSRPCAECILKTAGPHAELDVLEISDQFLCQNHLWLVQHVQICAPRWTTGWIGGFQAAELCLSFSLRELRDAGVSAKELKMSADEMTPELQTKREFWQTLHIHTYT
jgi:hypothetical protein